MSVLALIVALVALVAALLACAGAWVAMKHVHGVSGRFARHLTAHALDTEDQPARRHAAPADPDGPETIRLEAPVTAERPTPLPRPGQM